MQRISKKRDAMRTQFPVFLLWLMLVPASVPAYTQVHDSSQKSQTANSLYTQKSQTANGLYAQGGESTGSLRAQAQPAGVRQAEEGAAKKQADGAKIQADAQADVTGVEKTEAEVMKQYACKYRAAEEPAKRLVLANEFFGHLYQTGYIDEPIVFPAGAHMDSVDVNVWFYISEWYYYEGEYGLAVQYAKRAEEHCTSHVDEISKSDVYSQLGGAYFRASDYEKAAEALLKSYEIDRKSGDYDRLSSTLNGIGCVFVAGGKAPEAEKYVMEGIAANALTNNLSRRAVLFGTASEMYKAIGDNQKALQYATGALEIARETGDSSKIGVRLSQVANVQLGMGQVEDAKRSLAEAMPLLQESGNLHSYGICMNQMGDILANEGKTEEATDYYREAAGIFLRQKDMRNELHSREGLYRVTKLTLPGEAMLHLERAKVLQDSIYRQETGEALGKYNAIYYNDILQEKQQQAEHQKRVILWTSITLAVVVLFIIIIGVTAAWRYHKRKQTDYEQDLNSLKGQYDEVNKHYRNLVTEQMKENTGMTDDDRLFIGELIDAINTEAEKGIVSIDKIADHMHISVVTLRRRITRTLSMTPQAYVLQVRMHKAKYLLENYRDITIAEVSERCGYSQVPNFTRAFQKYYGISPKEARAK